MERKVLLGLFLLVLPFGSFGVSFHEVVKRGAHGHEWGYEEKNGPEDWPKEFEQCGGSRQSPINIMTNDVDLNDELDDFKFDNYDDNFEDAIIENNGHTIQVSPGPKDSPRMLDEGGMDDQYQFLQLHFHWGSRDSQGSEHLIDKKAFPMEMHLVHMNKNYAKANITMKEDGLAVLAVLFKVDDENNPALEPIIDKLDDVRKEGSKAKVEPFNLESLLPDNTMPYYRYKGSLTTPMCFEVVTWTIFKEFVPIGKDQLAQFRQVTEDDKGEPAEPLMNNFRPPQKLGSRVVEISGKSNSASSLVPTVLTAMFTTLAFIL